MWHRLKLPSSIPPKPNTALYDMIRYRGRKRWNLVRNYLDNFTHPGDIVLDPFSGCGVVAIEALKTQRRAIYNDLNPLTCLIGRCSSHPADYDDLRRSFARLQSRLSNEEYPVLLRGAESTVSLNWLYSTRCPSCGREGIIREVEWSVRYEAEPNKEHELDELRNLGKSKSSERAKFVYDVIRENQPIVHTELVQKCKDQLKIVPWAASKIADLLEEHNLIRVHEEVPIQINYVCKCKTKSKKIDESDASKLAEISKMEPKFYYPMDELTYKSGKRFLTKRRVNRIADLYPKRTLIALSIVKAEMEKSIFEKNRDLFDFTFAALAYRTTKPESVNRAWMEYWVPRRYLELNVLRALKERCKRVLAGIEEIDREVKPFFREGKSPADLLEGESTALFLCQDARNLVLPENMIDYVFTDPSYGEAVQYFELSMVGSSWLKIPLPFEDEIVVNEMQNKNADKYREMLSTAFGRVFKALKPGGYMTVTFHSPSIRYWNALMFAITYCGFEFAGSVYQSNSAVYTNWMMAKDKPGMMLGDMYITFQKPKYATVKKHREIDIDRVIREIIIPEARKIVLERGGYATYDQLVRGITLRLLEEHCLHRPEIVNIDYEKLFDQYFQRAR